MAADADPSDTLHEVVSSLRDDLQAVSTDLQGLSERLDMVEALADEAVQQAQQNGNSSDGEDKFTPVYDQWSAGDDVTVVVEDDGSGTKHGDPMGRVSGVVTFLTTGNDYDPAAGDTVHATVTGTESRHMRAVVREVEGRGDGQ